MGGEIFSFLLAFKSLMQILSLLSTLFLCPHSIIHGVSVSMGVAPLEIFWCLPSVLHSTFHCRFIRSTIKSLTLFGSRVHASRNQSHGTHRLLGPGSLAKVQSALPHKCSTTKIARPLGHILTAGAFSSGASWVFNWRRWRWKVEHSRPEKLIVLMICTRLVGSRGGCLQDWHSRSTFSAR